MTHELAKNKKILGASARSVLRPPKGSFMSSKLTKNECELAALSVLK
jgi:hypothetical protein